MVTRRAKNQTLGEDRARSFPTFESAHTETHMNTNSPGEILGRAVERVNEKRCNRHT